MTRIHIVTFRLLLIAALAAITHLATTGHDYPVVREVSDEANHVLAFYVLGLLVDFSFPQKGLGFSKISALLIYGFLIEVSQSFLPNRTPSMLDLLADGVGIASYQFSLPVLRHVPLLSRRWRAKE